MNTSERKMIRDESAWTGADLAATDEWIWELGAGEIGEIEDALAAARRLELEP